MDLLFYLIGEDARRLDDHLIGCEKVWEISILHLFHLTKIPSHSIDGYIKALCGLFDTPICLITVEDLFDFYHLFHPLCHLIPYLKGSGGFWQKGGSII